MERIVPNTTACEGLLQPCPAIPSIPAPRVRYLPAPLIRARVAALDPLNCLDLARTARMALYGILAFFDIRRPTEPIWPKRETLCAEAMLGSQPTLYRGLAQLEQMGYITREQCRLRNSDQFGQFHI